MKSNTAEKKKFHFSLPHTLILMVIIVLFAWALTWIIPAGEYTYVEGASGTKVVDPDSFHYIERTGISLLQIPRYIIEGFSQSIDMGVMILFAGGAFGMIVGTGAIQSAMSKVVKKFSKQAVLFVPIIFVLFSFLMASQTLKNFIAFAPIIVVICLALGLDSMTAAAIMICGVSVGYSTGTMQVISTAVAQKIAELPIFSGMGYRFFCFFVLLIPTGILLMMYVRKIQKDPKASLTYDLDLNHPLRENMDFDSFGPMDTRKTLVLITLLAGILIMAGGAIKFKWSYQEFSIVFLLLGIVAGIFAGYGPSKIAVNFEKGCMTMLDAWFVTAFAFPIANILADGNIINTIVYAICSIFAYVPSYFQGAVMFLSNAFINVFLTSGSGQAAAVMPIMIPVADAIGMTRQTAVLAFNFGDGFTNWILPSNSVLMATLAAANVPFDRWMKFVWKFMILWVGLGIVLMVGAQIIHLGPF